MSRRAAGVLVLVSSILAVAAPASALGAKAILVLDASGSMWGQIDGQAKIAIARDVIAGVVDDWDDSTAIGLIAYGHRRKGDCDDIEALIPVGPLDADAFNAAVGELNPKGKTPLSEAVRQAAQALRYTEDEATVILVSDGKETCDADPCAVATELETSGVDFTAHVVGFDVAEEEGIQQLQCLARNTGGRYLTAKDASGLRDALDTAVEQIARPAPPPPAPEPVASGPGNLKMSAVLAPGGDVVKTDQFRVFREETDEFGKAKRVQVQGYNLWTTERTFELPAGDYIAYMRYGMAAAEQPVTIEPGRGTEVVLDLNAGLLRMSAVLAPGTDPVKTDTFKVFREEKDAFGEVERVQVTSYNLWTTERTFVLPAGTYIAFMSHGVASAEQEVTIEPGQGTEVVLDLDAGLLRMSAAMAPGGEPVKTDTFRVFREVADAFGRTERVQVTSYNLWTTERTFVLPAGDYVAFMKHGAASAEQPVTIVAGQGTEAVLDLDAGLLRLSAVRAPGGEAIKVSDFRVFREEKDQFGEPERVQVASYNLHATERTFVLPAGEYIAAVAHDGLRGEQRVTIAAGEGAALELVLK